MKDGDKLSRVDIDLMSPILYDCEFLNEHFLNLVFRNQMCWIKVPKLVIMWLVDRGRPCWEVLVIQDFKSCLNIWSAFSNDGLQLCSLAVYLTAFSNRSYLKVGCIMAFSVFDWTWAKILSLTVFSPSKADGWIINCPLWFISHVSSICST